MFEFHYFHHSFWTVLFPYSLILAFESTKTVHGHIQNAIANVFYMFSKRKLTWVINITWKESYQQIHLGLQKQIYTELNFNTQSSVEFSYQKNMLLLHSFKQNMRQSILSCIFSISLWSNSPLTTQRSHLDQCFSFINTCMPCSIGHQFMLVLVCCLWYQIWIWFPLFQPNFCISL